MILFLIQDAKKSEFLISCTTSSRTDLLCDLKLSRFNRSCMFNLRIICVTHSVVPNVYIFSLLYVVVQFSRSRRSVLNFGRMVRCATGRNPFDFVNYGCYCGLGGSGKALDDIDRCFCTRRKQ